MVLSRIGHRQPEAITSTFMVVPIPATRMKIGTRTGGGIARRNSSTGSRVARSRGEEPIEYWLAHMDEMRASILISDDVSCGIVPIDTTLRAWREANGRANNRLAREAGEVWRVFCGLGHRLK